MKKQQQFLRQALLLALAMIITSGITYALAQPITSPPLSTIPTPLDEGGGDQSKLGDFATSGSLSVSGNLNVLGQVEEPANLCLDGECRSDWNDPGTTIWTDSSGNVTYDVSGGNVGIGTQIPIEKLDINGNTYIRSLDPNQICLPNQPCYDGWGQANYSESITSYGSTSGDMPYVSREISTELIEYCADGDGCHIRMIMEFITGGQPEKAHRMYDFSGVNNAGSYRWRLHQPGAGEWTHVAGDFSNTTYIDAWVCDLRDYLSTSPTSNPDTSQNLYFINQQYYGNQVTTCTMSIYD